MTGGCRKKGGFTLIELLVVIAIIGLLLAVVIPALRAAKEQAKKVICMAHMKGLGSTVLVYAQNHEDKFPFAHKDFSFGAAGNGANYYTYKHVPAYSEDPAAGGNRAGPHGLGFLWKEDLLDPDTDLAFCPSLQNLFGTRLPSHEWNSHGNPSHWNYVGPGSEHGYGLASYDTAMGWINMRITIGFRNMHYWGIERIADASLKGKRAYLSDLWSANPTANYWKTREQDIQHRSGTRKSINVWYIDGHGENVRMRDEWFVTVGDSPDRFLSGDRTWSNMFD